MKNIKNIAIFIFIVVIISVLAGCVDPDRGHIPNYVGKNVGTVEEAVKLFKPGFDPIIPNLEGLTYRKDDYLDTGFFDFMLHNTNYKRKDLPIYEAYQINVGVPYNDERPEFFAMTEEESSFISSWSFARPPVISGHFGHNAKGKNFISYYAYSEAYENAMKGKWSLAKDCHERMDNCRLNILKSEIDGYSVKMAVGLFIGDLYNKIEGMTDEWKKVVCIYGYMTFKIKNINYAIGVPIAEGVTSVEASCELSDIVSEASADYETNKTEFTDAILSSCEKALTNFFKLFLIKR